VIARHLSSVAVTNFDQEFFIASTGLAGLCALLDRFPLASTALVAERVKECSKNSKQQQEIHQKKSKNNPFHAWPHEAPSGTVPPQWITNKRPARSQIDSSPV